MEINQSHGKKLFPGELALLLGLIINSISVTLFAKSKAGMSTIALASYVLNLVFSFFSFGTWNYIVQCTMIIFLVILTKQIKKGYVISFFLAILYGSLIDLFNIIISTLPDTLPLYFLYYCVGFCGMALGTCLLFRCCMPVLPFDTFTRDISLKFNISYKKIRTGFDISSLVLSSALCLIFIGSIKGVGIGTVINALMMGMAVSAVSNIFNKKFYFKPVLKCFESLS